MEGDEIEMTKEELQRWIREQVKGSSLISPDLLEKCNILQSLLDRREKLCASTLKLAESVAACEDIVKKQYSLLGWEYKDTDSDDSEKASSPVRDNQKKTMKKELVVVLTRLHSSQICAMPVHHSNDDECPGDSDSDMQWEPEDDSSDANYSTSNSKPGPSKRRKIDHRDENQTMSVRENKGPKTVTANPNSSDRKASTPTASRNSDANANTTSMKASKVEANANDNANKTSTPPAGLKEEHKKPQSSDGATPVDIQVEISVDMKVIARYKTLVWKQGTVVEKVTKEDGRVKYKVRFKEKGKSIISGYHIASQSLPNTNQLFVGARVVVKLNPDHSHFTPGILAEVPNRKNRMRFLIICDNEMPIYVGLPFFHQVCQPLANPLDDIQSEFQKKFMTEYLSVWPYPPQVHYSVGQSINALYDGKQQKCSVLEVDNSLIRVVFQSDEHKEWLYRGSWRLEHIINMREEMLVKREEQERKRNLTN